MSQDRRRCQGKRWQTRRGVSGVFGCTRRATVLVETQVGLTEHRYCCDSDDCLRSISCGYPALTTPLTAGQAGGPGRKGP